MRAKFNISFGIISIFWVSIAGFSQPGKQPVQLGISIHRGFLLNHSPKRTNTHDASLHSINGIEINAVWQTLGTKSWHKNYGFPKWGASFIYYSIGSGNTYVMYDKGDTTLYHINWGDCYALLIHSSLKPVSTRFFELNVRLGTGLGYFTSVYNKKSNSGDLWISSHINPSMHLNIEGQFKLSPNWAVVVGGTFTHFSNGATSMPNLGVNFPSANIGLRFTPFPERLKIRRDSIFPEAKKNYFHVSFAFGFKVLAEFGTIQYSTSALSIMYGRRISKISKLLISLDGFQDESLVEEVSLGNKNIERVGIWVGHEFIHGNLGLIAGVGRYVYKTTVRDPNYYIKVGLRRYFKNKIFLGVTLKTHYGQADNFEWTLGYNF